MRDRRYDKSRTRTAPDGSRSKICNDCNQLKPESAYYKKSQRPNRRSTAPPALPAYCRECANLRARLSRARKRARLTADTVFPENERERTLQEQERERVRAAHQLEVLSLKAEISKLKQQLR